MAKIKINGCGYCSKSIGCKIKKDIRSLIDKYPLLPYDNGIGDIRHYNPIFNLRCPYTSAKYKSGDKITFTIGIQRYIKTHKWECENECDYCKRENCEDGYINFENVRYGEYVQLNGVISNYYSNGKFVIKVSTYDINKIYDDLNDKDKSFINEVSEALGGCNVDGERPNSAFFSHDDFYLLFISKQRFIKVNS
jgi:hypothetical protein